MEEFFVDVCEQLSAHVWLEALLVIIGTCFLEDVARCGVGLLVANGQIGWRLAFVSMTLGGVVGDLALYVIGRYASVFLYRHRWLDPLRLAWVKEQFRRHAFKAVMVARFTPGARTLVYCSAGIVRYPMPRFTFLPFWPQSSSRCSI
jgi:membrane protein DedA with SNARE-associated domain